MTRRESILVYFLVIVLLVVTCLFLELSLRLAKDRGVTVRVFCSSTSQIIERASAPTTFDVTCER